MTAEEFLTLEGRPTVRVSRTFPHSVERVWRAVTRGEYLASWFPSPVELDLRPGGGMRFTAFDGDEATGTVLDVVEPHRLTFRWGTDTLTFELEPGAAGTTFTLTHSFDDRYGAASFATGWEQCLGGLRSVLADEPLPPADRGVARHEELVHEFGLDRAEVTETEQGWTMRIERQLTCPPDVAWDLWFGIDQDTGVQRGAPAVGDPMTPSQAPDVVIGTMTEVDTHRWFAVALAPEGGPGDQLRLELVEGTGHGARVVLVVTGTDPAELQAAVRDWGAGAIGHLAASAASWAAEQTADAP